MMIAELGTAFEFKVWQAVQGGVDMVLLRAKEATPDAIRDGLTCLRTAGITLPVVVNAGTKTMRLADSNGQHYPEEVLESPGKVAESNKGRLLGISVHSVASAKAAEELRASYVLAGTVFETKSHPNQAAGGLAHLRAICEAVTIPVIAVGGITPDNAASCVQAGAYGVAALSPFRVPDRKLTARAYKAAMQL
jgi:thiamine-phosphate pyrophosphorylase